MARLVRAEILKLKNQEFVLAARVLGTSQKNIILHHLIPNTVGVIVINAMFTIPSAIFTEAFLSFIGIGLSEPKASLGVLINNGYAVLQSAPYMRRKISTAKTTASRRCGCASAACWRPTGASAIW